MLHRALPVVVLLLSACRGDLGVTLPPPTSPPAVVEATFPPAASATEALLWPQLYAGPSTPAAQRARMLAWFAAMEFTETQLLGFVALAREAQADAGAAMSVAQAEVYDPIYQELVDTYARGRPAEGDLAPIAARLAAAAQGPDPRKARYDALYALLGRAEAWVATLPRAQVDKLATCRIFLAASLGPLSNPGDYEEWAGARWQGQEFGAFRAGGGPGPRRAMDIGGLWAQDLLERGPGDARKVGILVLLAAREPGVIEAAEVRLGTRAAGDYGGG